MFKSKFSILLLSLLTQSLIAEMPSLTEEESRALLLVIADQNHFSADTRLVAFKTLQSNAPKTEPHYFLYCEPEEVNVVKEVPSNIYSEIVQSMTISCVDAFVYDFENKAYFMIQRTTPPGKGKWWIPGGRIFKGESFYESAVRKTKRESGMDICPIAQLGTYSTYFPESAWGPNVHTDTKNTAILALCDNQNFYLDTDHQAAKWVLIDEAPEDPYILAVYKEARKKLAELGFIN
ncbi:MAG: NUDIX domain-containing protein [Parachlamydiaceae bacterium]